MLTRILKIAGSALLILALAMISAYAADPSPKAAAIPATISGEITHLEGGALPPGSEAVVQLLDTSRADAPASVVAERRIAIAGQLPVGYRLDYDAVVINPRGSYAVAARIEHGGKALFVSETAMPVITRGSPGQADLVLKKATAAKP